MRHALQSTERKQLGIPKNPKNPKDSVNYGKTCVTEVQSWSLRKLWDFWDFWESSMFLHRYLYRTSKVLGFLGNPIVFHQTSTPHPPPPTRRPTYTHANACENHNIAYLVWEGFCLCFPWIHYLISTENKRELVWGSPTQSLISIGNLNWKWEELGQGEPKTEFEWLLFRFHLKIERNWSGAAWDRILLICIPILIENNEGLVWGSPGEILISIKFPIESLKKLVWEAVHEKWKKLVWE